jgi:hypothetical protein
MYLRWLPDQRAGRETAVIILRCTPARLSCIARFPGGQGKPELLFLKKKKQKDFCSRVGALAPPDPMPQSHKFFLLLFVHKKK